MHYKDSILDNLAAQANVAQFISFSPTLEQRYARIYGYEANYKFTSLLEAINAILSRSPEHSVNVRSFNPLNPKSREFIYGLKDVDTIKDAVHRLASEGLHTIINETIDIDDGGVSGVLLGDIIEFAPGDTPRCVEKPGTAALPRQLGLHLLKTVYGFAPTLDYQPHTRVEFSIHPLRRGFLRDHTIIWELEDVGINHAQANIHWSNRFSRFIGDKAYGLLIASLLELPVPKTTVISRKVAPFSFGNPTGSTEVWIRTCPNVQVPGKFTTQHGWLDPFQLMQDEDPNGDIIASIIAQAGIEATYSGALMVNEEGTITIEGTKGFGEDFMVGIKKRDILPHEVINSVKVLYEQVAAKLGEIRMEWVADASQVWIVQLHCGATKSSGSIIYPGNPSQYHEFDVEKGLEALRELISSISDSSEGILLLGDVGITSHFGDVLRRAEIPSKIIPHDEITVTKV
ncbi:MAG: hypothetical protein AB4368_16955 [Xenococcaceae cyanobacterium]